MFGALASMWMVRSFFDVLITAPVLAMACWPIHAAIRRRIPQPVASALLSTVAVTLVGVLPLAWLLTVAFEQGRAAVVRGSEFVRSGGVESLLQLLSPWLRRIGVESLSTADIEAWLVGHAESLGRGGLAALGSLAGSVAASVGTLLFVLFVLYFCFAQGPELFRRITSLTPLSIQQSNRFAAVVRDTISANVNGVLIVGLAQGGLTGAGFAVAGLPSAVFWGTAAGIASVLPPFGAAVVWLPGAMYLALTGDYWRAALLGAYGAVIIASADNVIRPIVVGSKVSMGTLPILLSILGGLQTFGLIGLFLGPVLFAATAEAVRMLREEWR